MGAKKKNREKGMGTIEFIRSRKKPYRAKVADGFRISESGKMQTVYRVIGSYRTKSEAEAALQEYSNAPYDISSRVKTFRDLYAAWSESYKDKYKSEAYGRTVSSAYSYCSGLYNMSIRSIGPGHIKDAMEKGFVIIERGSQKGQKRYASKNTQARIKSLCNLMFDYAVEHRILTENPARTFKITKLSHEIEDNRKTKKPFTDEQVACFWKCMDDIPNTDMILIGLYTGYRPQELLFIRISDIDMEQRVIYHGMKTRNGRNRMVPIHSSILPLIEKRMEQEARYYHTGMLFNDTKRPHDFTYTYDKYRRRFEELMMEYGLCGYTPHCTRHTFTTAASRCKMDAGIKKRILGHSLNADITESVYTHPTVADFHREMSRLTYTSGETFANAPQDR